VGVSSRKKSLNVKVDSNTYHVDFKNVSEDITRDDIPDAMSGMLGRLVEDVKSYCNAHENDHLHISIHHPSLKSVCGFPSPDLDKDLILDEVVKVQQANEQLNLEDRRTTMTVINV